MEIKPKFSPNPKLKLMYQVRQVPRYHHFAYRTEQTYCDWIVRYIKFHGVQTHPAQMDKTHMESFLSHLAIQVGYLHPLKAGTECHHLFVPPCTGPAR